MKFTGGLPETECGNGSTLETTANLRAKLPTLLVHFGVNSLLDAPCGDCNWIPRVNLAGVRYVGIDNSLQHIQEAQRKAPFLLTIPMDIFSGLLPECDAVLCRDFLQHLPHADVSHALDRFKQTGAKWLLATSFDSRENVDLFERGGFRRLNLEIAPINLGGPVEWIDDPPGSGRILGAWRLQ